LIRTRLSKKGRGKKGQGVLVTGAKSKSEKLVKAKINKGEKGDHG